MRKNKILWIATDQHFTSIWLPCDFWGPAADIAVSMDTQSRCAIEFLRKPFLLGFVNRFDSSFQEIVVDLSRLDLSARRAAPQH